MSIIEKIKQEFERATGLSIIYQSSEMVNVLIDTTPLPCGWWYIIDSGQVVIESTSGEIKERLQARLYVGDKTSLDFDAIINEQIITQCKEILFKFVKHVRTTNCGLEIENINQSKRFYLETDAIVTGYMLDLTIKENQGINICCL